MAERIAVCARILGRVQGVWYRSWTVEQAIARGLDGWVRNRADGSVEALFAGSAPSVREMIAACRKGPAAAVVTDVIEYPAEQPTEPGFVQRPTA